MKLLIKILLVISLLMIGFNVFQINWNAPNWNENIIALIGIISSSCALVLILILMISNKISEELPQNNSNKKTFMDSILKRINYFSNIPNKKMQKK